MIQQPVDDPDTTSLSYWLNWRVFLCSIWVLVPVVVAVCVLWKYERVDHLASCRGKSQQKRIVKEPWRPCLDQIHPVWLLTYRVIAFCFLLASNIGKLYISGFGMLLFYTQWTYALVNIYFGFGSLLSFYGCFLKNDVHRGSVPQTNGDAEQGYFVPLTSEEGAHALGVRELSETQKESFCCLSLANFLFQILFQMTAGASMITDFVYWAVIFPYYSILDYPLNFMTMNLHTTNAVFLLGEAALNCLPFPWFRMSYFILLTGAFVIFQWILHACMIVMWPYPFLDLSSSYAPLWYFLVAAMHVPCYGFFVWIVNVKHGLLIKWFPQSYEPVS